MKYLFIKASASIITLSLFGCAPQTVPLNNIPARKIETQKLAVGSAQILKRGMSGADVISSLGSPNVITTDKDGFETWVYDKISNEYEYITAQDGGWLLGPKSQQSGVEVKSQRTLIVVIKFDETKKISNVQYRQTSY